MGLLRLFPWDRLPPPPLGPPELAADKSKRIQPPLPKSFQAWKPRGRLLGSRLSSGSQALQCSGGLCVHAPASVPHAGRGGRGHRGRGTARFSSHTERQLPAPPAGLRVWTVSSALTCVLFPGSECPSSPGPHPPSSPALWNLSCRPPTAPCGSQGCCPHSPRPELSAPPLPCGLGVLSPSRWPSTSSVSITGPSAWPIPRRDCELAQGLGPREAAPPQSGP